MGTPAKTPGPTGLTAGFYKKFHKRVAPLLTKIANRAMKEGTLPHSFLQTIIVTIPKKGKPLGPVKNVRPISLLEIHRKIITRAANNRLKNLFKKNQKLIEMEQACHPKRNIEDNLATLNLISIISNLKKEKNNNKVILLDFEKAFDRVDHQYILDCLKAKGFGPLFRNFIKSNLRSIARIQIGNSLSKKFITGRGVPQGDVLSPLLFLLAINPLIVNIKKDKFIKGIKIGKQTY